MIWYNFRAGWLSLNQVQVGLMLYSKGNGHTAAKDEAETCSGNDPRKEKDTVAPGSCPHPYHSSHPGVITLVITYTRSAFALNSLRHEGLPFFLNQFLIKRDDGKPSNYSTSLIKVL